MKPEYKTNEKGAIMVEILAVLALIGVMGPMLFRQVVSRNQEISNVNMASEMRTIKEATSAFIAADGAKLGRDCLGDVGTSGEPKYCGVIDRDKLYPFLPAGMGENESAVLQYYIPKYYAYWVDYGTVGAADWRPFTYAVIVANSDGNPSTWNFRRAARVASLIGADGGVVNGGNFIGTNGAWELPVKDANSVTDDSVVVTTAFDTFEPDLGIVSPNAVYAPESLAFKQLHAWNYFSVGDKDEKTPGRCFRLIRTMDSDKTLPDEIYKPAQTVDGAACDPLFWVGTSGGGNDKSTDGYVYAKKNVYVGRDNTNDRSAIALETNTTVSQPGVNDETVNKERRIVVYDIGGKDKLTIDATGRIIANKDVTVNVPVDGSTTATKKSNYGLDPANTSVLNDVRLTSRGGARLSDILPNYITKDMYLLSNGQSNKNIMTNATNSTFGSCSQGTYNSSNSYSSCTVPMPTCPAGYKKALILQPMKWKTGVEEINIPLRSIYHASGSDPKTEGQFWLTAPAGGGTVTGGIQIAAQSTKTTNPITVKQKREVRFAIQDSQSSTATGNFTVQMGYPYATGDALAYPAGELQAVAQTYCVYDTVGRPNSTPKPTATSDTLDVK